ncbi:hypothetical protein BDW74DRAFT_87352 [Aspergillus multicolor]|uniref:uncharacterized protein n=1 Tax=Aspergillus multicolor TaxID=41759 RepID=UPI003CCE38C9
MAGTWSEQSQDSPSPYLKKRKRDLAQPGDVHPVNNILKVTPHHPNDSGPLNFDCLSQLKYINEYSPRLQSLSRKRRVLQQPGFSAQSLQSVLAHQFLSGTTAQPKPPSQSSCASTNPNALSPPLTPKSLVPRLSQRNSRASASSLRSCHICHRKPSTKEFLEAYADCDLCGQRACFICLRRCDAVDCWSRGLPPDKDEKILRDSLSRMVCSCCAVEGVTESGMEVVRCLVCIR